MAEVEYSVETYGLTKRFGDFTAVDSIDLRVEAGCFYGFLGPNGAGKSTTIKMLTGLLAPTSGRARLLGLDLEHDSLEIKRRLGVLPEDLCLFENLTAREYLTFVARMYGVPRQVADARREELLELLGLADTGKVLVLEFSHGMQKKLALAAALIHDPQLLFLDEPFEGVDAITSRTIRNVLKRMLARHATIFLTSHILEIVGKLCTHLGIVHEGRVVVQGPLGDFGPDRSLEDVFVEAVGQREEGIPELSWLAGPGT